MSIYRRLIIESTGANEKEAGYIEGIMRDDIFHSTLDWVPRDRFMKAAKKAQALLMEYRKDPSYNEEDNI